LLGRNGEGGEIGKKYLAYYFAMKSTSNKQVVFHSQSTDLSMIKSLREISMVLLKSKNKDKVGIAIHQIDKALK